MRLSRCGRKAFLGALYFCLCFVTAPATGFGAEETWDVYENCSLMPHPYNDGDSFHVETLRRNYVFRLYFVDAPETDTSLPERVDAQAAYWGLTRKQAVRLGEEARRFTKRFLKDGFTAQTKREDARGRSERDRVFALVTVKGRHLSEALVREGLVRVYGARTDLPDGRTGWDFVDALKRVEQEAKQATRGGWRDR